MICKMKLEDVAEAVEHGASFFKESYYNGMAEYDPVKTTFYVSALINDENGIVLKDTLTGAFFIGHVGEHWFNNMRYAYDYCIYVPPQHRGSGSGYKLLKAYVEQAKALGADEIFLGDIASIDQQTLFKIHEKLGLTQRSKTYSLVVGGK